MDTKKLILAVLAGTVTYFILGFLVYGVILMDMMNEINNADVMRAEEDMKWGSMILSNVFYAVFLSYAFMKANVSSFSQGAMFGAIVSCLIALSVDTSMYAWSTMINSVSGIVIDAVASLVMGGVTGGVIGWVLGRGSE